MGRRRFTALLTGLSPESVLRAVAGDDLAVVDDPAQIQAALHN